MATKPITRTTFTPGPWRVSGEMIPECLIVEDEDGDFIAQTKDAADFASLDSVTNARLISAAPELFEALYQYRNDLRHPPAADSIERRLAMIEKLIAKTEGR